ncbi:MAG: hypothetical protein QCH31_11700 [Methanolobus sp.]|nr:hypothetical protein [Methanolobus sp.]
MQIPKSRQKPKTCKKACVSGAAVIAGNVTIEDKVFIAPNTVIRKREHDE